VSPQALPTPAAEIDPDAIERVGINKSQPIRDFLGGRPGMTPFAVAPTPTSQPDPNADRSFQTYGHAHHLPAFPAAARRGNITKVQSLSYTEHELLDGPCVPGVGGRRAVVQPLVPQGFRWVD
jgi:hypothetical protein